MVVPVAAAAAVAVAVTAHAATVDVVAADFVIILLP